MDTMLWAIKFKSNHNDCKVVEAKKTTIASKWKLK